MIFIGCLLDWFVFVDYQCKQFVKGDFMKIYVEKVDCLIK